ncbi:Pimeloyl-ACP methyl ester carboxylesterase [Pedococcus cremeus]|uniref:Pimeloyl-ACP methyl ester carboxylesterase n=1 Tax=Pedococcus cremeus TaxID=587636 RepID=A0A1H9X2F9_9MICO|nr:alpha/beta hydrolase [Pedococcus cremeus]SES39823.1 Pimeloyl-ACP methyl ester carboxylesterase [Pedococcus cremeus]
MNGPSEGMASLSLGAGPPLLLMPGLTPDHRPPTGMARRAQLGLMRPLAQQRQVWWVNRRQGLPEGTTMAELADDYATMLREWQAAPIDVVGVSTGGEVALQLAADHPELVRRLVLVASACRLGAAGHEVERRAAEALERGDRRTAASLLWRLLPSGRLSTAVAGGVGWLLPGPVVAKDHSDLLATMRAELAFDLSDRLHEIATPTLVVGGSEDASYGEAVFRETASGLPFGHLALRQGRSHAATVTGRGLGPEVNAFLGRHDS